MGIKYIFVNKIIFSSPKDKSVGLRMQAISGENLTSNAVSNLLNYMPLLNNNPDVVNNKAINNNNINTKTHYKTRSKYNANI